MKVFFDGRDIGAPPVDLKDADPGERKLRVLGDRYAPMDRSITIVKDEVLDLGTLPLKVVKGKATIQLGTPGARVVLVSGTTRKEVPQFPLSIEFGPDEKWELQATKDGFDELREHIAFEDGQAEKTITVTLKEKGSVTAAAAASASAAASTKPARTADPAPSPKPTAEAPAPTGESAPGETSLKLNSLPSSTVSVDGKTVGTTPTQVAVTPGSHSVTFVNAELSLKKSITVDVKQGETKPAFAKLRE